MWLLLQVTASLQALKFDTGDYVCLKFILLLNAGQFTFLMGHPCPSSVRLQQGLTFLKQLFFQTL
jgi:hypothetical protein